MAATAQGVIIPAAGWGKVKTMFQVAAIFFLIAFDPTPLWVDLLVYVAVAVTVISGIDYFFGLRRMLREAEERRHRAGTADGAGAKQQP
jgi:CDP-diacylglycerol--glycerol-3-phosphate 3-phosphatidyltransferase